MKNVTDLALENIELERTVIKLKKALYDLVELKDHKDAVGKDEWYKDAQPMAWKQAEEALRGL